MGVSAPSLHRESTDSNRHVGISCSVRESILRLPCSRNLGQRRKGGICVDVRKGGACVDMFSGPHSPPLVVR